MSLAYYLWTQFKRKKAFIFHICPESLVIMTYSQSSTEYVIISTRAYQCKYNIHLQKKHAFQAEGNRWSGNNMFVLSFMGKMSLWFRKRQG